MSTSVLLTLNHVHDAIARVMVFGVTEDFERRRRDDHKTFYCPTGHPNVWRQQSEAERLRRDLRREREALARKTASLDQTEASLRATKGVVTKQRKKLDRVQNGVCPCCNRTFVNLARHMAAKHPGHKRP